MVDPEKIIIPPLHIKLGLMKNIVKAMNRDGDAFLYLRSKFPNLSDAKIRKGMFIGPQTKKLFNDPQFDEVLTGLEKKAWNCFKMVATNFLGSTKAENYVQLVEKMLSSYEKLKCNISLKVHFMHSHLDFFF